MIFYYSHIECNCLLTMIGGLFSQISQIVQEACSTISLQLNVYLLKTNCYLIPFNAVVL